MSASWSACRLRGEQQHTQRQVRFFACFIAHSFSPESLFCFVDITLPQIAIVGGKEEKILIYNQKRLNKPTGILYARRWRFYQEDGNDCRAVPSPQGEGRGRGAQGGR
ncbi:hypothetical protein LNQ03_10715 [Klebsiella pneumoniae subsp. pneumoniae]|nr:hypothetical protein [Klebsiella pneumoniae subsp. pneumoniae]